MVHLKLLTLLLCFTALYLSVAGKRTHKMKRNIQQESCVWSTWEDWSNCTTTCGAPTRTRVRDCLCDGEVSENAKCLPGLAIEEEYCPKSCIRSINYWRYYNDFDAKHEDFDKPWPIKGGETNVFYCRGAPDADKMRLTWLQIIRRNPSAQTDIWYNLAAHYITALLNVAAGANTTNTRVPKALVDAEGFLDFCDGYAEPQNTNAGNVYKYLASFNAGKLNYTVKCDETPCCFTTPAGACSCPGYGNNVTVTPEMCNQTVATPQPQQQDEIELITDAQPPQPIQTQPTVPEPVQTQPIVPQPKPVLTQPTELNPVETLPTEPQPAQAQRAQPEPVQTHPAPETKEIAHEIVPCVWSDWSESICDASCGGGKRTRVRQCSCDNTTPATACPPGSTSETKRCNTHPCPTECKWLEWGEYSACSVECGGGVQSRKKPCSCPEPAMENGSCPGDAPVEEAACNVHPCEEPIEPEQPQALNITEGQGSSKPVDLGQGSFDGVGNGVDEQLPQAPSTFSQELVHLVSTSYFLIPVAIILVMGLTITVTVLVMRRVYSGRIFEIPDVPDDDFAEDDEEIELDSATLKKLQVVQ